METVNFNLTKHFEYGGDSGETEEAEFIEIREPSAKDVEFIAPIQQAVVKAIKEVTEQALKEGIEIPDKKDNKDDDDGEQLKLTPQEVIQTMQASNQVDMTKMVANFELLFYKTKLFYVDGEIKFTKDLVQRMSISDFYNLAGRFIVNFIIASL